MCYPTGTRLLPARTAPSVAPYSLLRLGLTRFAELRLSADGFTSESGAVDGAWEQHSGGSDLEIASKVRVLDEKVHLPALAFIAGASVPTGAGYFSSGRVNPFLELCWSKSLPGGFDAGGNVNFQWGGTETEHAYSLSVGHKLGRGFGVYGEIYRISPIDGDEAAHWVANSGITKLLGTNAQLDIEAGHTVNARTPYWFVGAGFAIRMPNHAILNALLLRVHLVPRAWEPQFTETVAIIRPAPAPPEARALACRFACLRSQTHICP